VIFGQGLLLYLNSAKIHFCQFEHLCLNKKSNTMWNCMWMTRVWSIWIHRSNIIFINVIVEEIFLVA